MARKAIVVLLVVLQFGSVRYAAAQQVQTIQERVLELSPGTLVEVKMKNKQTLRGRMGEAASDGFQLQYAKGDRLETKQLTYTEVKSLKAVDTTHKSHFLAGVGAAFLVLMVIGLIGAAIGGGRA